MLRPPLCLAREGRPAERASRHAVAIDRDVELENTRSDGHGPERTRAVRADA